MKHTYLFIVFVSFLAVNAQAQSLSTELRGYKAHAASKTWTAALAYGGNKVQLDAVDLTKTSDLLANHAQLFISKEFFAYSPISISILAEGGYIEGKESRRKPGQREKITGYSYGGGLSLNYNFYGLGFRMQPFISAKYLKEFFSSSLPSGDSKVVNSLEAMAVESSIGFRIFDAESSMMSFVSVDYFDPLTRTESIAEISGLGRQYLREPLTVNLGFGFFF